MISSFSNHIQTLASSDGKLAPYIVGKKPSTGTPNEAIKGPQLVIATHFSVNRPTAKKKAGSFTETTTVWLDLFYLPENELDHAIADQRCKRLCDLIDKQNTKHKVNMRVQARSLTPDPESALWRQRMVINLERR